MPDTSTRRLGVVDQDQLEGSGNGSGSSSTPLKMLKTAAVTPMPSPNATTSETDTKRERRANRAALLRSRARRDMSLDGAALSRVVWSTNDGPNPREAVESAYTRPNIMAVRINPEKNEPAALNRIGAEFGNRRVLEVGCGDGRLTKTFRGDRTLGCCNRSGAECAGRFIPHSVAAPCGIPAGWHRRLRAHGQPLRRDSVFLVIVMNRNRGHGRCPAPRV